MKYRAFIEDNFLIDEPKLGKMVPFKFNVVQNMYYDELVALGIEKLGIAACLRELVVKARREGFSSMILALFAADDILQKNPTESQVVSYKDDATATFRRRYRRYVLSYYAMKKGITLEQIQADVNILESVAKEAFFTDSTDLVLRHNRAHFYCGTASSRTGGRGGVLQKLLFSEAAHYPDTENMTAKETIEGAAQQVDKESGWIFQESTGNGVGNHFYKTVDLAMRGLSRYILRFYGWRSFYSEEQFAVIRSEFTDSDMLKQEYPETIEEAFLSSNLAFTNRQELLGLVGIEADKELVLQIDMQGVNYVDQCDTMRDLLSTYNKSQPDRDFYVGIDSGKDIDRTALTLLRSRDRVAKGTIRCISIDATGAGDFVPDWFERNTSWYIHRVKFSRPVKSVMYKNLRVVLQDRQTKLPPIFYEDGKEFTSEETGRLFRQMTGLQKEVIGEMLVVAHPKGKCTGSTHDYDNCPHHDDYPDSWALAEIGYIAVNGVQVGQRAPEETPTASSVRRLLTTSNSGRANMSNGSDSV